MYGKIRNIKFLKVNVSALLCILLILSFSGCGGQKTITVAALATPHSEILKECVPILREQGYKLVVREVDDYNSPNMLLESGEVDANFFQHEPFLEEFNSREETHIVSVTQVHYEPYAIYSGTENTLRDLPAGSKIAVPNDPTNEGRALRLLEEQGLIKLRDGAGLKANKNDITENRKNLNIVEIEASVIPKTLNEVAVAVINGNYAIAAGLKISDALAVDNTQSAVAQTYANVLAVKEGNEQNEAVLALARTLESEKIKSFINETYGGAAVAVK